MFRVVQRPALDVELKVRRFDLPVVGVDHAGRGGEALFEELVRIVAGEVAGFGLFEDVDVAFFGAGLEKDHRAAVASGTGCATDAVEMVVFAEWRIVFDYEVDIGKIKTAGGNICTNEDCRSSGVGEGFEGGGSSGLLK
jgi:hypothetical protein